MKYAKPRGAFVHQDAARAPLRPRALAIAFVAASAGGLAACSFVDLDGLTGGEVDASLEPAEGSVRIVYITPDATTTDGSPAIDAAGSEAAPPDASDAGLADASDAADADSGSAYAAAVLADDPAAYWPMDEAAGSLAAVDVINGLRAPATGTVTFGEVGAVGKAVRLDGASALNPVGAFFDLVGRTPFAIEMWAKADNVDAGFENISGEHAADGSGYVFYLRPGPQVQFEETWPGSMRDCWKTYAASGDFDHLVITLDESNQLHIFANGIEATSATEFNADGGPAVDGGKTALGSSINGLIDEVAFYTHGLDETRVSAHYLARRQ